MMFQYLRHNCISDEECPENSAKIYVHECDLGQLLILLKFKSFRVMAVLNSVFR